MKKETKDAAAALLELIREKTAPQRKLGPEWKTKGEWAAVWGLGETHTDRMLRSGVAMGLIEKAFDYRDRRKRSVYKQK